MKDVGFDLPGSVNAISAAQQQGQTLTRVINAPQNTPSCQNCTTFSSEKEAQGSAPQANAVWPIETPACATDQ